MSPRIVTRIATTIACVSLLLVGCSDDGGGGGPMGGGDLGPFTPSGNDAADMLALVNSHRASGADCGSEGVFGPAPALTRSAVLEQRGEIALLGEPLP